MVSTVRFSVYVCVLIALTFPSMAAGSYIYDVAVDYQGGYTYSFSMEFLDNHGQKSVSDLVGGNFQNKAFTDSSGDFWAPSESVFTSVKNPAPTYLNFDPFSKNLEFTSPDWFTDPSPAPLDSARSQGQGQAGLQLSESQTPLDATVSFPPTESVSVDLTSSPPIPPIGGSGNPKIHGLYIGIDDTDCITCLDGSKNAEAVMKAVADGYQNADIGDQKLLVGSTTPTGGLGFFDIFNAILDVSAGMSDEDIFLLYINGHGGGNFFPDGGETTASAGDEIIQIGNFSASRDRDDLLFDDELSAMLSYAGIVGKEKLVILDSCHSGGFWGDGGEDPSLGRDLSQVPNTSLLAASDEISNAYYSPLTGRTFFNKSIVNALSAGNGMVTFSELADYVLNDAFILDAPFVGVTELAIDVFGRTINADEATWSPQYFTNSNAEPYFLASENRSVPEPKSFFLLLIGLAAMGLFRFLRNPKATC